MLSTLFTTQTTLPPEQRERAKRYHSINNTEGDEAHARKKDRIYFEIVRRASLILEDTRQIRARELAAGESSSRAFYYKLEVIERRATEGAKIDV